MDSLFEQPGGNPEQRHAGTSVASVDGPCSGKAAGSREGGGRDPGRGREHAWQPGMPDREEQLMLALQAIRTQPWTLDLETATIVFHGQQPGETFGLEEATAGHARCWYRRLHRNDRSAVRQTFFRALRGQHVFDAEARIRVRDGEFRWVGLHGVVVRNRSGRPLLACGTAADVTARRDAESGSLRRERELKTLVENAPDLIARVDPNLRYLCVNRAVESYFGHPPDYYQGRTPEETGFPATGLGSLHAATAAALHGGGEQVLAYEYACDCQVRHYATRVIPEFGPAGAVESLLLITYDETRRRLTERERDALLIREQAARADAEAAARARDQFLAVVSHELRSPLNGIQSWAYVLEGMLGDEAAPGLLRALAGIRTGVEQQVRLIEDLLDVTCIMSGKLSLDQHDFPLRESIDAALESVRATANERRIRVRVAQRLQGETMRGDPDRVQQIVWNLLSNAIKFTPVGGLVELRAARVGNAARIMVRDTGRGIPREFLPCIFDPFRQVDASDTRRAGGLGLGLALVKKLTELHGGTVEASSGGDNAGATFTLTLPLIAEASGEIDHSAETDARQEGLLSGVNIMLIDDQGEAREALGVLLRQCGASVVTAESGQYAMRELEQLLHADVSALPDILICDIAMPDEDGYQVLNRIRRWEAQLGIPQCERMHAVALTAFTRREDQRRALSSGFRVHLSKPVTRRQLTAVLTALAAERGRNREPLRRPRRGTGATSSSVIA